MRFLVGLADDPLEWTSPAYLERELRLEQHLGEEHFFRKGRSQAKSPRAPFAQ